MRTFPRVLIIEDDIILAAALKKYLGVQFEVETCDSIAHSKALLTESRFNCILLDKCLPDGNGVHLIGEIKTQWPTTAVIVLTGDAELNAATKCLSAGADDYIIKSENLIPELFLRIPASIESACLKLNQAELQLSSGLRLPLCEADLNRQAYEEFMNQSEKVFLERALDICAGDAAKAARAVGLARSTIFRKFSELGVSRFASKRNSNSEMSSVRMFENGGNYEKH